MKHHLSMLHVACLLGSAALLCAVGLLWAFAPGTVLELMGLQAADRLMGVLRVGSAPILAEVTLIGIALASRSWFAIRLVTVLLIVHFTAETVLRTVNFAIGDSDTLVTAVPQAVLAVGLGWALIRHRHKGVANASARPLLGTTGQASGRPSGTS
jgi:hypothetical protein